MTACARCAIVSTTASSCWSAPGAGLERHQTLRHAVAWSYRPARRLGKGPGGTLFGVRGWFRCAKRLCCSADLDDADEFSGRSSCSTRLVRKSLLVARVGRRVERDTRCWRRSASSPRSNWSHVGIATEASSEHAPLLRRPRSRNAWAGGTARARREAYRVVRQRTRQPAHGVSLGGRQRRPRRRGHHRDLGGASRVRCRELRAGRLGRGDDRTRRRGSTSAACESICDRDRCAGCRAGSMTGSGMRTSASRFWRAARIRRRTRWKPGSARRIRRSGGRSCGLKCVVPSSNAVATTMCTSGHAGSSRWRSPVRSTRRERCSEGSDRGRCRHRQSVHAFVHDRSLSSFPLSAAGPEHALEACRQGLADRTGQRQSASMNRFSCLSTARLEAQKAVTVEAFDAFDGVHSQLPRLRQPVSIRTPLGVLSSYLDRMGRFEPAATIAGFALQSDVYGRRARIADWPSLTSATSSGRRPTKRFPGRGRR